MLNVFFCSLYCHGLLVFLLLQLAVIKMVSGVMIPTFWAVLKMGPVLFLHSRLKAHQP